MSPSLRSRIDEAAEKLGISAMEYIRRACEEKLGNDNPDEKKDEIKKLVLQILDEAGIQCKH